MTPLARDICRGSWLLSGFIVAYGIRADGSDFWTQRPFLTNLMSSLAAALSGIPTGVVFIRWISETQTAYRDPAMLRERMRLARGKAKESLTELASSAESFLNPSVTLSEYEQAFKTFLKIDESINTLYGDRTKFPALYPKLAQEILSVIPTDISSIPRSCKAMLTHWNTYCEASASVADIEPLGLLDLNLEKSLNEEFDSPAFEHVQNLNLALIERLKAPPGKKIVLGFASN
jgi:hypothetical protein